MPASERNAVRTWSGICSHTRDHHMGQARKSVSTGCVRKRFCRVPPRGHHQQPDRGAWTRYVGPGRKLVLDIHGSYLRCHESPPTTGCWQVTRAWLDLAWQTLRYECPLLTESKKLRWPTLRQFPGRPDVAIKLSLALEKLTFLCEV